ncbi:MAG: alkaline phosphatase family protein, partial [Propionibacteriaceae bacterium]
MTVPLSRTVPAAVASAVLIVSAALSAGAPAGAQDRVAAAAVTATKAAKSDPVLFFAADGLRQDLVTQYANQGEMPAMRRLLRDGASATGGGLLTQAPPNTGAGWYSLATGAWPAVTG